MSDLASLHRSGLLPRIAELAYVPDPTRVALDVPTSQPWSQLMVVVDDLRYDLDQAGPCTWDDIYLGAWVRFGSDREGTVVRKYTRTPAYADQQRWLEIRPDDGPNFPHPWSDGEPCYLESLF